MLSLGEKASVVASKKIEFALAGTSPVWLIVASPVDPPVNWAEKSPAIGEAEPVRMLTEEAPNVAPLYRIVDCVAPPIDAVQPGSPIAVATVPGEPFVAKVVDSKFRFIKPWPKPSWILLIKSAARIIFFFINIIIWLQTGLLLLGSFLSFLTSTHKLQNSFHSPTSRNKFPDR